MQKEYNVSGKVFCLGGEILFYIIPIMSPSSNRVKAQADNCNSKFFKRNETKEKKIQKDSDPSFRKLPLVIKISAKDE